MVGSDKSPLQDSPKAFNAVGMYLAVNIFDFVIDPLEVVVNGKLVI